MVRTVAAGANAVFGFMSISPSSETLSGLLAVRLMVFGMQIYWAVAQIWRSVTTAEAENETVKHSRRKAEPVQCCINSAVRFAARSACLLVAALVSAGFLRMGRRLCARFDQHFLPRSSSPATEFSTA